MLRGDGACGFGCNSISLGGISATACPASASRTIKPSSTKRLPAIGLRLKTFSPCSPCAAAFDLLLQTVAWPAGSEIVFSALNIPDMTMVARQHGIVPVPADLDLGQLAPNLDLLEKAITPRTQAILIAHLYGNFVPLEPIVAIARRHKLMLIEDFAENYDGVYTGYPGADVSLFSFGPLKTATSLAGGILSARDPVLFARLSANHAHWPTQSRLDYFNRLCKYGTMKFFGGAGSMPRRGSSRVYWSAMSTR